MGSYHGGANGREVNQKCAEKGRDVESVSARIDTMGQAPEELIESLKQVGGVIKIDSIVD